MRRYKILLLLLMAVVLIVSMAEAKKATFAGGCFWCMEPPFEKMDGVREATAGFMGGHVEDPEYDNVASGKTGHREVVQVYYDPDKTSYRDLLSAYWRQIDPTDDGGQFVDRGFQYTSAIFYHSEKQKRLAQQSKKQLDQSDVFDESIVTPILEAETFYPANDYHQDYYRDHSWKYRFYRYNSGRDSFLEKTWADRSFVFFSKATPSSETEAGGWSPSAFKKPSDDELQEQLGERAYYVTQQDGTEPAFQNELYDHKEPGIYVDVVSGEPLFSSEHKYESGTGWPSFYKPLQPDNVTTEPDYGLFGTRTEVRSKHADSHLGHVFDDGPPPTGKRYCLNSAALRFVPADELDERGYEQFADRFD